MSCKPKVAKIAIVITGSESIGKIKGFWAKIRTNLFLPLSPFRLPCRPNAAKIAIIITDGKSQDPSATAQEAQRLRDKGVTIFSIGVGSGIQEAELKAMATDPDNQHVFVVNNFDALDLIKASLQRKTCEGKALSKLLRTEENDGGSFSQNCVENR